MSKDVSEFKLGVSVDSVGNVIDGVGAGASFIETHSQWKNMGKKLGET